jgi:uncharacterized membrane protein YbaN (DUF454 family)
MMVAKSAVTQGRSVKTRLASLAYAALGFCALALAVVGVIVPGLPTTVFVIVAAYCFARSVPAWERRLVTHRWLGAGMRRFRDTGGMSRRAKAGALAAMWVSVGISALVLARTAPAATVVVIVMACIGTLVLIFRVPTVLDTAAESSRPLS